MMSSCTGDTNSCNEVDEDENEDEESYKPPLVTVSVTAIDMMGIYITRSTAWVAIGIFILF